MTVKNDNIFCVVVGIVLGILFACIVASRAKGKDCEAENYPCKMVGRTSNAEVFRMYDKRVKTTVYFTVCEQQLQNIATVVKRVKDGEETLDTEEGK